MSILSTIISLPYTESLLLTDHLTQLVVLEQLLHITKMFEETKAA